MEIDCCKNCKSLELCEILYNYFNCVCWKGDWL